MTTGATLVTVLSVAAILLFLAVLAMVLRGLSRQLKARRAERSELRAALVEYGLLAGLIGAEMQSLDQCGRIGERVDALLHRIEALARISDSKGRAVLQQLATRVQLTRFVLRVAGIRAELRETESSAFAPIDSQERAELEPRLTRIRDEIRSTQQELSGPRLAGLLNAAGNPDEARRWKGSAHQHLDELHSLAAAVDRVIRERAMTTPRAREASPARTPFGRTRIRPSEAGRKVPLATRLRIARSGTRVAALAAFERALMHEAHTLVRSPNLIWQQIHNRLQWEGDPVPALLVAARDARSTRGTHAWLRTRIPFRESSALIRTFAGHTDPVNGCAVAPDATFLVSASGDGTLKVWDTGTGIELATLTGHTGSVSVCGVSADGRHIVSGSSDGTVRIWDVATGDARSTITGHTAAVVGCAYHPDGRRIASIGEDGTLRIWDATTGKAKTVIQLRDRPAGLAFTPDGALVVSGAGKMVKVWDIASGQEHVTLGSHQDYVTCCVVSPDGETVASTGLDGVVRLWNLARGSVGHVLKGHAPGKEVWSCAFSPDGSFIVSAGADYKLIVWDTDTGARRGTLQGHSRSVTGCAVAPDGSLLLSSSSDHTLKLWSIDAPADSPVSAGHEGPTYGCAIADRFAVTAGRDGAVRTWDLATGKERVVFTGHRLEAWACAVAPGGGIVVSAGEDETLRIWDPPGPPGIIQCRSRAVRTCAISTDSELMVSGGADGTARIWRRPSGAELAYRARVERIMHQVPESGAFLVGSLVGHTSSVNCSAFSRDRRYIVTGSDDSTLKVWDVASRTLRATLQGHKGPVWCCAVSPDGAFIVSGGDDGTLRIWDVAAGRERISLTGHSGAVRGCAVAPDGAFVLSAGEDKLLNLWDVEARAIAAQIPLPGEFLCAAWHPREPLIACGDRGGSFHLLDVFR